MEFIYLAIGLVVGAIFVFFLLNGKLKKLETKNVLSNQQLAHEQELGTQLQAERDRLQREQAEQQQQLITIKLELERVTTQLESEQASHSKETEMRREQFEQQLKTVQEQFSNLATRILEQTSERLKTTNNESMEHLTKPLKMNIEQLQQAIQHTNTETSKNTASLSQQLREMSLQTQKIETTATRLTNVIRGGNKAQGNWGERILTDILESQGYKVGIDYDIQHTLTDEKGNAIKNDDTGRRMIPDVILHYPNNEDVIIDAKMSIDAYYQYVNTEEEALKKKFAADLVSSIRTQATNLAKKDYSKYVHSPRKAIDFV
ncbi:MAG: DNA recombination protein RmuC, partial [Hoylesella buccalis]